MKKDADNNKGRTNHFLDGRRVSEKGTTLKLVSKQTKFP